jgi:hypothetical protein
MLQRRNRWIATIKNIWHSFLKKSGGKDLV